jgi:hypothetical protein
VPVPLFIRALPDEVEKLVLLVLGCSSGRDALAMAARLGRIFALPIGERFGTLPSSSEEGSTAMPTVSWFGGIMLWYTFE